MRACRELVDPLRLSILRTCELIMSVFGHYLDFITESVSLDIYPSKNLCKVTVMRKYDIAC